MRFLTNIDMSGNEVRNARAHVLAAAPASPAAGQFYYNSATAVLAFYDGTAWILLGRLNQVSAPNGDVSFNGFRLANLADGTDPGDAVTRRQLDNLAAGIDWKESVRAASTSDINLTTGGLIAVDGVTLAAGDRVLVKDQATASGNGIYVASAGAWSRAADADSADDIRQAAVFVREGSMHADTGWVLSTNPPITLDTTSLTFTQFTGVTITAGAGLAQTGNTFDVNAGSGLEIVADVVRLVAPVAVDLGGTGATTAADARANLGATSKASANVGDGTATSIAVAHNLGTTDVVVMVRDAAVPGLRVFADVEVTDINTVTLTFSSPPAANAYRVVVIG